MFKEILKTKRSEKELTLLDHAIYFVISISKKRVFSSTKNGKPKEQTKKFRDSNIYEILAHDKDDIANWVRRREFKCDVGQLANHWKKILKLYSFIKNKFQMV